MHLPFRHKSRSDAMPNFSNSTNISNSRKRPRIKLPDGPVDPYLLRQMAFTKQNMAADPPHSEDLTETDLGATTNQEPRIATEAELTEILSTTEISSTGKSEPPTKSTNTMSPQLLRPIPLKQGFNFTAEDQDKLSENEHYRFLPSSAKVGHALIQTDPTGNYTARQFTAPGSKLTNTPKVRPLINIELINKFGAQRARATTPDGTAMVAMRSINITEKINDNINEQELWLFSPVTSHQWQGDIFWGSADTHAEIFLDRSKAKKHLKEELDDLNDEIAEIGEIIKQGSVVIDHTSVKAREENPQRKPDQNTVMHGSAIDAYKDFHQSYNEVLTKPASDAFKQAEKARPFLRGGNLQSQRRPEWLHLIGHSLTPLSQDPQVASNLAAAPKYLNTMMLMVERPVKWHALYRPQSSMVHSGEFVMLLDSDLMKSGVIRATITENNHSVELTKHFNAFVKYPKYPKPTDIMQITLITHSLLTNQTPSAVLTVTGKLIPRKLADKLDISPNRSLALINKPDAKITEIAKIEPSDADTIATLSESSVSNSTAEYLTQDQEQNLGQSAEHDIADRIARARLVANTQRSHHSYHAQHRHHHHKSRADHHQHNAEDKELNNDCKANLLIKETKKPRLTTYKDFMRMVAGIETKYGHIAEEDDEVIEFKKKRRRYEK